MKIKFKKTNIYTTPQDLVESPVVRYYYYYYNADLILGVVRLTLMPALRWCGF